MTQGVRNTYHDEIWREGPFGPPPTDHVVRQRLHLRLRDPVPVRIESSRLSECVVAGSGRGEVGGGDGGRVHVAFQVEVEEFKHERERLVAVDDVEEPLGFLSTEFWEGGRD